MDIKKFEGDIILSLVIKNDGAAHLVPTGPPTRMAYVKVSAFNKTMENIWSNFKENPAAEDPYGVFHIVFSDISGKKPSLPWMASKIVKDTRIRSGESRKLVYIFPAKDVEHVEAKLFYRLAPPLILKNFKIENKILEKPYLMSEVIKTISKQ